MSSNGIIMLMRLIVISLFGTLSIVGDNLICVHIIIFIIGYDVYVKLPLYIIGSQTDKLGYDIENEKASAAPLLIIFWLAISIIVSVILYKLGIY